jgi:hypothetical protein
MNGKNSASKKKGVSPILWAALLLGLLMPVGAYYALQNGLTTLAVICFALLSAAMGLTAWKG